MYICTYENISHPLSAAYENHFDFWSIFSLIMPLIENVNEW